MRNYSVKNLVVYTKAYKLASQVYVFSKSFPNEEKYALTSQIRRCSRSVCLNLREAWAKRRYVNHFICKLSDCDGENSETDSCLDFARDCGYITAQQYRDCVSLCNEVGRMLCALIDKPDKFLID